MRGLRIRRKNPNAQRGQALVELAVIVPVLMLMIGGVVEFGFLFAADMTIESASREGARTAAALGNYGTEGHCPDTLSETNVDPTILSTVQTALTRSGVDLSGVGVNVYRANANGDPTGDLNSYVWNGFAFIKTGGKWDACGRHDGTFAGGQYDQVGVEISYTYHSRTGLLALFSSGVPMTARAVFPIGPPWKVR
jgi:Flp pilus assembly protein TadG